MSTFVYHLCPEVVQIKFENLFCEFLLQEQYKQVTVVTTAVYLLMNLSCTAWYTFDHLELNHLAYRFCFVISLHTKSM
jgi:ABC-type transport system involved in Fe-S cluster assembly fused permease/ATPase subunit